MSGRRALVARALLGTVIAGQLAASGALVYIRAGTGPVSIENAVARFREARPPAAVPSMPAGTRRSPRGASPSASTSPRGVASSGAATAGGSQAVAPSLPAEGVYVYDTEGWEELEGVGGSRHAYPAETTITVWHEGCGIKIRWAPLRERWEERWSCPTDDGAERLLRFITYHEFFGQGQRNAFTCDRGSLVRPARMEPGARWKARCTDGEITATSEGRVVGFERVVVGEQHVRVAHLVSETTLTGAARGRATHEGWVLPESGLIVRRRARVDSESDNSPMGTVRYREQFEQQLRSLQPER